MNTSPVIEVTPNPGTVTPAWMIGGYQSGTNMQRLTPPDDTLLTLKEAQAFLRVSRSKIYRLMQSGQLVGHKVGVGWRFYREDLKACVSRR